MFKKMFNTNPGRPRELRKGAKLNAYIEEEQLIAIHEIARKEGKSVSKVVREAIEYYLKRKGKLKGEEKEEDKDSSDIDRVLRNNRIIKLKARLSKLREVYRKALVVTVEDDYGDRSKSLEEIIKLAEDPRTRNQELKVLSGTNRPEILTPPKLLARKRDELSAILDKVDAITLEAKRLGAKELSEESKELSKEISEKLTRLLSALDKLIK